MAPITQSPIKPSLSYSFSRSPAKDLQAINEMMRNQGSRKVGKRLHLQDEEETTGKRILLDDTQRLHAPKPIVQLILDDREAANGQ
jgi:hypothetical protein